MNTSDDSDIGYMVEVCLTFPQYIHELLKLFVPCPEHIIPNTEWFSEYLKYLQVLTHDTTNHYYSGSSFTWPYKLHLTLS